MPRRRTQPQQQQRPRCSRRTNRNELAHRQQRRVAHLHELEEARLRAGEPRRSPCIQALPGMKYVLFGKAAYWDPTDLLGEELPAHGLRRARRRRTTKTNQAQLRAVPALRPQAPFSSHEYDHTPEGVRKTTPEDGLRFATGRGQRQAARDNDDTEGPEHAEQEQHYQVRPGTHTADRGNRRRHERRHNRLT
jgi:hypothetical protein